MRTPGPRELFTGFAAVSLMGFGGVLPFAHRALVEQRKWLTPTEFTDVLALGVFLPGGSITNVAVLVGHRFAGWRGALAGVVGLFAGPLVITLVIARLYQEFGEITVVRGAVHGLAAAAAGLLLSMAVKLLAPYVRLEQARALAFIIAAFVAVGALRLPLLVALVVLTPASVGLAWRRRE